MSSIHRRLQETILGGLWRVVSKHANAIVLICLVLSIISGGYAFWFLRMNGNQDILVSEDVPFQKTYLQHLRNFGDQEYLYVVIETQGTDSGRIRAAKFAERLAEKLSARPDWIKAVHYRISPRELGDGALFYAPVDVVEGITSLIPEVAPYLREYQSQQSLDTFLIQMAHLLQPAGGIAPGVSQQALPPLLALLERFADQVRLAAEGQPSAAPILDYSRASDVEGFFFTRSGRLLVMRILPHKDYGTLEIILEPLEFIRRAMAEVRAEFPDVSAGLTGRPALQADEMETTNWDMTRASIIDTALVALLFVFLFKGWIRPLLIMLALVAAMAWTFGFATIAVGELNLLSVIFALVLVGIGVDYGVHMVLRFAEADGSGSSLDESVRTAIVQTGPGVILGVVCTVCTFYAVLGSDFRGLAELGLIGGTGILLCLAAMMILLPAMLLRVGRRGRKVSSSPRVLTLSPLNFLNDYPKQVLLGLLVLTILGVPGLYHVGFSYNLLELQAKGLESVDYERRLVDSADESTWFAILTAPDVKAAQALIERVSALPGIRRVESLLDFLPTDQEAKARLLRGAAGSLEDLESAGHKPGPVVAGRVADALKELGEALEGLLERLFATGAAEETRRLEAALSNVQDAIVRIEANEQLATAGLTGFQDRLRAEMTENLGRLRRWLRTSRVGVEDLPESVRNHFVGKDGWLQIKVSPSEDVWDFDKLQDFVATLRTVDPQVSGVPVTVLEASLLMHSTFLAAASVTVVLVSIILWVYSRSLQYVLLTLLPLAVGMLWLLELMGLLGVKFNLANFFSLPILIAIGVDGGVHLLDRWQEMGGEGTLFSTSTPTAVASSFVTTVTGFGGLVFASHRGLASLGAVMVLGSICGMLACLLVLPSALKVVAKHGIKI